MIDWIRFSFLLCFVQFTDPCFLIFSEIESLPKKWNVVGQMMRGCATENLKFSWKIYTKTNMLEGG